MARSRRLLAVALGAAGLVAGAWGLDRLAPPSLERLAERSVTVTDRQGRLLRGLTTAEGMWRLPVRLEEVSADYLELLIRIEDKRFWSHPGVDPVALLRAAGQLLWHGRIVSGGSTLTMQLARLLEPTPRTVSAKVRQIARALQLEWRLDKRAILEAYLTLVPMGGNLEGVRAGSLAWLGKEPALLTPAEAALLVALPQSPTRLRPDVAAGLARAARDRILARAGGLGLLGERDVAAAVAAPVPTAREPLPFSAPHLAEQLARDAPSGAVVATTLDGELQRSVEQILATALAGLPRPINVAAIVLDHRTSEIRALAGSAGHGDVARAGAVDFTAAVRSPGSTLKPFLYGLAFEASLAHPQSIVADRPTRFDDYAPENFERSFDGEVTLRQALQRSLNLPAVMLLERLGPASFVGRLEAAGVALELGSANAAPGLPVILGGVGIDLRRLVQAYGGLAHGGELRQASFRLDEPVAAPQPLMAREAALAVTDILADLPRPKGFAADGRKLAYKTGTSHRYRDGWAVGFDGGRTVGVWVGRPDGASCRPCNGPAGAAPILFRLFDLLPETPLPTLPRESPFQGAPPAGLARLESRTDQASTGNASGPRISFPVEGAMLLVEGGNELLQLRVEGGERPYRWHVDEAPLGQRQWRKSQFWAPGADGFRSLRVIDAGGRSHEVGVRVRFRRGAG